jgi:hypothetical protein
MKRLGDDITHVFLPGNRAECTYEQLRYLKKYELDEEESTGLLEWLLISCTGKVADELIATYDAELLAESLDDCFQACVGNEAPFFGFPLKSKVANRDLTVRYLAGSCTDMCFGQFVQADEQLMLFTLTKSLKHLWKLCGILCRPQRETVYGGISEEWVQQIKRVHDVIDAWLILDFFMNARDLMRKRFSNLFPVANEGVEAKKLTFQDVKAQREAYDRKIVQYSERPSEKEAQWQTNVWTVLEFIDNDIFTAKTLKEQQNKWEKSQRTKGTSRI